MTKNVAELHIVCASVKDVVGVTLQFLMLTDGVSLQ